MRKRSGLACWWAGVWLFGLGTATGAEWKAGVARVDTTPTEPVWMSGYASRSSPSQGVAHPLCRQGARPGRRGRATGSS